MPTTTPNLGLKKPLGNEIVSRQAYNENLDLLDQNVTEYKREIEDLPRQSITLSHGLNAVNAPRASLLKPKFTGRTLVNLLGKDGNCEDVGKWLNVDGSSFALDPAIKMFGTNSIKVSSTVTGVFAVKTVSKYNVAAGKYYLLGGWAKNIDCAGANGVKLIAVKGSDGITGIKSGPSVSIGTSFVFTYAKLSPADIGSETTIHAYLQGHSTVMGQNFNFDGLCLYEITQAEYDALATMTDAQIAAKYPYVDSVQVVQNPAAKASSSYLYLQTPLYEGETLEEIDGQWVRTKKREKKVLDGSLTWLLLNMNTTGYKVVLVKNLAQAMNYTSINCVKYDGKIIPPLGILTEADAAHFNYLSGYKDFYISISNADSGWGENYIPTADEIKAYFYGWKMYYEGGTPYDGYNGTGTKRWAYHAASGWTAGTNTLPTGPAPSDCDWKRYELHYQLATPVTEVVPHEGELRVHEGLNQVEVFEGVVVRELASPVNTGTTTHINSTNTSPSSLLKNKTFKILDLFKNNKSDISSWIIYSDTSYINGKERIYTASENFDPTAQYSVTYIALPEEFTAPCPDFQAELTVNLKTTVDSLVDELANVATDVTALEMALRNRGLLKKNLYANISNSVISAIPNDTWTKVIADLVSVNTGLNISNGVLIITKPGRYIISSHIAFANNAIGARGADLRLNGTGLVFNVVTATTNFVTNILLHGVANLKVGDSISLYIYQNSGSALNLNYANINITKVSGD